MYNSLHLHVSLSSSTCISLSTYMSISVYLNLSVCMHLSFCIHVLALFVHVSPSHTLTHTSCPRTRCLHVSLSLCACMSTCLCHYFFLSVILCQFASVPFLSLCSLFLSTCISLSLHALITFSSISDLGYSM